MKTEKFRNLRFTPLRLLAAFLIAILGFFPLLTCNEPMKNGAASYFFQLEELKKKENWGEIVFLGEKVLEENDQLSAIEQFQIADQLVSSYFRLGFFEKAREKAELLIVLSKTLEEPETAINSLYKFSAAIRGQAGSALEKAEQSELFATARHYAEQALLLCEAKLPSDLLLKAKVLFNAGAAECDDPDGDLVQGIASYQEALKIFIHFEETDYQYRTQLRLGKALLLCNNLKNAAEIVEEMKQCQLEERTLMHWHYLEAQVLIKLDKAKEALASIHTGISIAKHLNAQVDLRRFEILLEAAYAQLKISELSIGKE